MASRKKKKKLEFSKLLAFWAAIVATLCAAAEVVLPIFDKATNGSTEIFIACIGYLITYAGKSLGEKMTRNKYGLNDNGLPYQQEPQRKGENYEEH